MEDNLKRQIEDIMRQIDEQKNEDDSTGTKNTVHVYILDASAQWDKVLNLVRKAFMHNWAWVVLRCLLVGCIGLLFSLFPLITTTTNTITSSVRASMTS